MNPTDLTRRDWLKTAAAMTAGMTVSALLARSLAFDGAVAASVAASTTPLPSADLPPLLQFADGRPVRSAAQWACRRAEIRALMCHTFVGTPPTTPPALLEAELLEATRQSDGSGLRRVRLTFDTRNRASFDLQLQFPAGEGPFPVFLFASPYGWWPDVALERGYLVCGYPGADNNDATDVFAKAYPECTWSRLLRRAWLGSRALDYLLTLPEVIPRQICMSGHSRNGKQSLIAAAFDERITAVVSSSAGSPGSSPYRFTSHDTFNEAPDAFVNHWFLESLRNFTGREHELPLDSHGWYGLIAPRPCLISTAWNDGCDPTFAVERAYLAGREVYRFLDRPEALRIRWRPGWHGANRETVQAYFDWFDHWFGRPARPSAESFPETLLHTFDWDAWRAGQSAAALVPPDVAADLQTRVDWLRSPWTTPPPDVNPTAVYNRLAQAGYAVLAFDQCGFGLRLLEGRDYYKDFPEWSRFGRMLHDVRRAVGFLVDGEGTSARPLPAIDAGRIVAVGYALGGMVGLHAAALDARLAGVAAVCGCLPWRDNADAHVTGGIRRWWQWHALLPKLGLFDGREREIPYDVDDLLAAIAPRHCLLVAPQRDRTINHQAVTECVARARARSPQPDRLTLHTPDDINRLQAAQQDAILAWLEKCMR